MLTRRNCVADKRSSGGAAPDAEYRTVPRRRVDSRLHRRNTATCRTGLLPRNSPLQYVYPSYNAACTKTSGTAKPEEICLARSRRRQTSNGHYEATRPPAYSTLRIETRSSLNPRRVILSASFCLVCFSSGAAHVFRSIQISRAQGLGSMAR